MSALWRMDAAEIAQAIARIELSSDDLGVMPPREAVSSQRPRASVC